MSDTAINKTADSALCRIANGDMDALEVIYRSLGRRIYLLALSILRDTDAAQDVMQEVFLRIAAAAGQYKEGTCASAWILTITRNLALISLEKRRRTLPYDMEEHERLTPAEEDPVPMRALEAMSLLEEDERQIVILKLDAQMKHRAIAELLGISVSACEKRYRRALEKLKSYYNN